MLEKYKNLPLRNGVGIILLNKENKVFVGRRIDNPAGFWQMPQGGIDENEKIFDAAKRELREETGFTADKIEHICSFWTTPGFTNELMHAYLATGLHPGQMQLDEDEILSVITLPLKSVVPMIRNGEIRDAKSIASLMLVVNSFL